MGQFAAGNKDDWEFEYTASKLAEGARAQKEFRDSRVAWWKDVYETVMAEIRESGINITESSAAGLGKSSNYGTRAIMPTATIDAALQAKLSEAHSKVQQHLTAAAEYDGWVQVLDANPESRLKLTQGDWLYFFGKK